MCRRRCSRRCSRGPPPNDRLAVRGLQGRATARPCSDGPWRLETAVNAYREAARLAPDRSLAYVGLGAALARLERVDEALAAFRAALDRAPDDEKALQGRADLLAATGRPAEAAAALDRLAEVLERADRVADACDVARRALELAESRGRRRLVEALVSRLSTRSDDPAAAGALERARADHRGRSSRCPGSLGRGRAACRRCSGPGARRRFRPGYGFRSGRSG